MIAQSPQKSIPTGGITPDVVARAQAGDAAAFGLIFEFYHTPIYNFVGRTMGSFDDAADIAQDAFVKAWRKIGDTSDDLSIRAWLFRIAFNCCMDNRRRNMLIHWQQIDTVAASYVHSHLPDGAGNIGPRLAGMLDPHLLVRAHDEQPDAAYDDAETAAEVQRLMLRMTPHYRVALVLREYCGFTCDEIGEVINATRPAVKSMLFRAREQFRQLWAEHGPWHPVYQRSATAAARP